MGYPTIFTVRNQKRPSASVVNLPLRFICACDGSWFSYSPTGEACQTSTSASTMGLPALSCTRADTYKGVPGVSERTMEPPFGTRGEFRRQNGRASDCDVSVSPRSPLLRRHTRAD